MESTPVPGAEELAAHRPRRRAGATADGGELDLPVELLECIASACEPVVRDEVVAQVRARLAAMDGLDGPSAEELADSLVIDLVTSRLR